MSFFVFDSVPDQYKTQEMRDKVVFKEPSVLKYCIDNYKIQEMCYKAVGAFLTTVNFVSDWFATNKMLGKLDDVVFFEDDKVFLDEESDNVTFFSDDRDLVNTNLNNVSLYEHLCQSFSFNKTCNFIKREALAQV